MKFFE